MVILNKKRCLFITFLYMFLLVFIHSICFNFRDAKSLDNKEFNPFLEHSSSVKAKTMVNKTDNYKDDKKLKEELKTNNDFIGNLYIENENFIASIVQTEDNSFYLNHNINKEKSGFGAPFLDYRTKLGDKKLIIYGHNSRNVKMPFSVFENYYDKSYYDNHKYIFLDTVDELRKYEVFSVYIETKNFDYMDLDFPTKKGYFDHLNDLKNKSMYETRSELTAEDEILIIQTCSTHKDYRDYSKKFLLIISRRVN